MTSSHCDKSGRRLSRLNGLCRPGRIALGVLLSAPGAVAAQVSPAAAAATAQTVTDRLLFGAVLGAAGMAVVFIGLLTVFVIMTLLRRLSPGGMKKERDPAALPKRSNVTVPQVTAEVAHAIGLALYMDLRTLDDSLDEELTIKRITRPHSPWWYSAQSILIADNEIVFTRRDQR